MRDYIERNRLKTVIEKNFGHGTIEPILQLIDESPTADVQPVVRGEWTREYIDKGIAINIIEMTDHTGYSIECVTDITDLAVKAIKEMPTADVVEVVRCKDCEYYKNTICQNPNGLPRYLEENEFCSNGKRRTE